MVYTIKGKEGKKCIDTTNRMMYHGRWKGGDIMTLADRIKKYRCDNLMSQMKFAQACNLSKQTVNSIENGTQEASLLTRAKIEKVIGKEE